jgi:hypothetical protein
LRKFVDIEFGHTVFCAGVLVVLCHGRIATDPQQGHRSRRRTIAVATR